MLTKSLAKPDVDLELSADAYRRDGALYVPQYLDVEQYFEPLWSELRTVIDLAREQAGLPPTDGDAFDAGLAELRQTDRRAAGRVYDAVRKLPGFFAIATAPEMWELARRFMDTDLPGWYAQGSGIRMDHPTEDRFLSPWHQEYPSHLNSLDMLVLWLPLVPVDDIVGSVMFCPRSHKQGILPVYLHDPLNDRRNGAQATEIADIESHLAHYPETSIDTEPGDVLALHGLTLHRSQPNKSNRTRWSIQLRYLNFLDPTARRIGWCGGMLAGVDLRDVHPEAVIPGPDA